MAAMRTLRVSSASSGIASSVASSWSSSRRAWARSRRSTARVRSKAVAHPLLAHDRGHLVHADAPVVGPAQQRGLARLAEQPRAVVADPLHEQPRRILGDREALGRRPLLEPVLHPAARAAPAAPRSPRAAARPAASDRSGPARRPATSSATRSRQVVGLGSRAYAVSTSRSRGRQRLRAAHDDQAAARHERQRRSPSARSSRTETSSPSSTSRPSARSVASANSPRRHQVERVVEELLVGAVQQGDGGRLASLGGLQECGVVHGAGAPRRALRSG